MYKEEGNKLTSDKYIFGRGEMTHDVNINVFKFNIQLITILVSK